MELNEYIDYTKLSIESLTDIKLIRALLKRENNEEAAEKAAKKILEIARKIIIIELEKCIRKSPIEQETKIGYSFDVYNYMKYIEHFEQENFFVLLLDSKMKVISKELIYIGTVNEISIHPREVFKTAIRKNTVSIILVHNHPSGSPEPSDADIKATKILMKTAEIINIAIVDHIIIGKNKFYSFNRKRTFDLENKEKGEIENAKL